MVYYTADQKRAYAQKKQREREAAKRAQYSRANRSSGRSSTSRKAYNYLSKNYNKPYMLPGAGAALGALAGGAIGGPAGSAIGSVLGKGAHSVIKTITGFGDYTVKENFFTNNRDAVPEFIMDARAMTIVHREYIQDVLTGPNLDGNATSFDSTTLRINPASIDCFPWLSAIARNFEQYVIQGMVFEFKSNSATAVSSTNTALGTVIMATQYNSLSPAFVTKQQMENHEYAQSSTPSESILHPIECDPRQTQNNGLFDTAQPGAAPGDVRFYDIGKFTIATQGMQAANVNLGELWISYKISFLKPKLMSPVGLYDHFQFDVASAVPNNAFGDLTKSMEYDTNTSFVTLLKNPGTTSNACYIKIDSSYSGLIGVCYNVYGGASTSRCPNFIPSNDAGFVSSGITQVALFNNNTIGYMYSNYNNGGTTGSGTGASTFQVYRCTGGQNMYLTSTNMNISTTGGSVVGSLTLDIFSLGVGRLGNPVLTSESYPPVGPELFKALEDVTLVDEVKNEEPSQPDVIYLPSKQKFYDLKTNTYVSTDDPRVNSPARL